MVATTRRVRDEEDSGGELGEANTGQGSLGSTAPVVAAHDRPAADTAGDAQLRPALKRGAKYQRVGEAAGGCIAIRAGAGIACMRAYASCSSLACCLAHRPRSGPRAALLQGGPSASAGSGTTWGGCTRLVCP